MKDTNDRATYSVAEFANQHGVSERAVWDWIKNGHIETIRLGRLVRIPAEVCEKCTRDGLPSTSKRRG